jgi:hypothetical protein
MRPELPNELVLVVIDFAAADAHLPTTKALRLVNRECARRFARPVWFVGARAHYLGYLLQLNRYDRENTMRWLFTDGKGSVRLAAEVAAEATRAAVGDDTKELFRQLSKCTKFRR